MRFIEILSVLLGATVAIMPLTAKAPPRQGNPKLTVETNVDVNGRIVTLTLTVANHHSEAIEFDEHFLGYAEHLPGNMFVITRDGEMITPQPPSWSCFPPINKDERRRIQSGKATKLSFVTTGLAPGAYDLVGLLSIRTMLIGDKKRWVVVPIPHSSFTVE